MALRKEDLNLNLEKLMENNRTDLKLFNSSAALETEMEKHPQHENEGRKLEAIFKAIRDSKNLMAPPKIDKEAERESKAKAPLYRLSMFSEESLIQMHQTFTQYAFAIDGMPMGHKQALEKRGWLLPFLFAYDELLTGRWNYWTDIMMKKTIEGSGPIPQIEWETNANSIHQVKKMLFKCMDGVYSEGATASDFADWLMWGLAATKEKPKISDKVSEHWYRTFDMALVLLYPTDYLSGLLEDLSSKSHQQALGYFSTPASVTQMMVQMIAADGDPETMKTQSVCDPCIGCGAMLLPMSNYCLFGYGQDINPVAVKFSIIQMYWYAPWFAVNPFNPDTV